jgi:hypothetical protein
VIEDWPPLRLPGCTQSGPPHFARQGDPWRSSFKVRTPASRRNCWTTRRGGTRLVISHQAAPWRYKCADGAYIHRRSGKGGRGRGFPTAGAKIAARSWEPRASSKLKEEKIQLIGGVSSLLLSLEGCVVSDQEGPLAGHGRAGTEDVLDVAQLSATIPWCGASAKAGGIGPAIRNSAQC